jgi:hypothetical protein
MDGHPIHIDVDAHYSIKDNHSRLDVIKNT